MIRIKTGFFKSFSWLRTGALCFFIPLSMVFFLQVEDRHHQLIFLSAALALTIGAILLAVFERIFFRQTSGSQWLLVILSGAMFLISLWNTVYLQYIGKTGFRLDVFREPVRTFHAPLYGLGQDLLKSNYTHLGLAVLFFMLAWKWLLPHLQPRGMTFSWIPVQLALLLSFAYTDGVNRLEKMTVHFSTFAEGLRFFKSVPDLLTYYVPTMGKMGEHNNHYPPGNLLLLFLEQIWQIPGLVVSLLFTCILMSTVMIGKSARLLGWNFQQQLFGQGLFVTAANVLIFSSIDFTPIPVLFFASGVYLLIRYFKTGEGVLPWLLGIVMGLYLFFSFTVSLFFLFAGFYSILLLLSKRTISMELWRLAFPIVIINALAWLLVYGCTEFDIAACFKTAMEQSGKLLGSGAFDNPYRYIIRSTGNLLGFVAGSGVIAFSLMLLIPLMGRSDRYTRASNSLLPMAGLLTIIAASFSGLFFMETERVWCCLVPVVSLAAAHSFHTFSGWERDGVIISAIFTASVLELYWSQI